jgi:hypothetical protein
MTKSEAGGAAVMPTCAARTAAYVLRSGPQRLRVTSVPADQVEGYWGARHLAGGARQGKVGKRKRWFYECRCGRCSRMCLQGFLVDGVTLRGLQALWHMKV